MRSIRFGTDGIRGPAGEWPLTSDGARVVGTAIALWARGPIVVGWDTRESSSRLADALLQGITGGGVPGLRAGVLPTPALSCAVGAAGAAAGVMVTASHNLWEDNGLKVVRADGRKLFDSGPVEAMLGRTGPGGGPVSDLNDAARAWRDAMPAVDLRGRTILLDCANGAAVQHAPAVLERLGATVRLRGAEPNGRNINDGVGALHPPTDLGDADLAICVDGDGDRLAIVDRKLGLLDGDDLLFFLAGDEGPVVGTSMTNGGLDTALGRGRLIRAEVGDRFVAEAMTRTKARLGGEPSGHLLFADGLPTSCGIYTALRALAVPWRERFARLPQVSLDIRAAAIPEATAAVVEAAERAGHRVIVRRSGTEAVVRVMVEGVDAARWAEAIGGTIRSG